MSTAPEQPQRKVVPREPTHEMLKAGDNEFLPQHPFSAHHVPIPDIWRAMYDRAPDQPAVAGTQAASTCPSQELDQSKSTAADPSPSPALDAARASCTCSHDLRNRSCPVHGDAAIGEPRADVAGMLLKQTISDWLADGEPHPEAEVMHHVWSMLHGASIYIAALESAIRELQAEVKQAADDYRTLDGDCAQEIFALNKALKSAKQQVRELQADKDNMMEAALKIRSQRERAESLLHDDQRIIGEVMDRALRAEAELAAVKEERKDWARRFMLDGETPWGWQSRCRKAEAERDAAHSLLRECLGDYGARNFTDRHHMADRIRAALARAGEKE